jgi:hypothetical protein
MNLEERFLNQAAAEKLPEGIVEVGELTRDPEQFSADATKRGDSVGFANGAAKSAVSGGSTAPTNLTPSSQVTSTGQKPLTPDEINKLINDPALRFSAVSDRIRETFNNEPQSELIPLNRTMRQELAYSMQQLLVDKFGVDNYRAGRLSESVFGGDRSGAPLGLGLIDVTPFVIPLAFQESGMSAKDSFKSIERGNLGQAALEYGTGMVQGAEAIPAVGMAVKGLKAGAKSLAPNIADVMESGMRKTGMTMDIVPDGKSVMQQAPKSDIGFYSAVENAAVNVQRKSGAGQSFLNDIMKGENVKAEEIKWIGLDDFLKGKKNVTKQEVQDYIANNKVDVQEVRSTVIRPLLDNGARPVFEGDKGAFLPKFGQYVLEGGENYRELLLTMPDKRPTVFTVQADSLTKEFNTMDEANAYKNTLMQQYPNSSPNIIQNKSLAPDNVNYKSSHFPDQRNILAHLRVNDRVDDDGKKMLLIEEVQSDWHQAGRDKGYRQGQELKAITYKPDDFKISQTEFQYVTKDARGNERVVGKGVVGSEQDAKEYFANWLTNLESEEATKSSILRSNQVPDAPFKDTWYQLALKRALQHAAENGYERVGLTTGKQQVDRFDLSKQVNAVSYHPDDKGRGMFLNVFGKNNEVIYSKLTPENEVANVIGKETAKKLLEQKPIDDNRVLQGLDLKIGGEGMKKYYDEIYPKFLEKYGKKWNAKMGETGITTGRANVNGVPSMYPDKETVRYIDITPEMKAGVKKGQPLFAAAPIGAATGAATMQDERKK